MDPRTLVALKSAALPVAATTLALVIGGAYFAGTPQEEFQPSEAASVLVNFEQPTPVYAPAARMPAGASLQQTSSIDLFRQANPIQPVASAAPAASRRTAPSAGGSVSGFSQQQPQDITEGMDKLAEQFANQQQAAVNEAAQVIAGRGRPYGTPSEVTTTEAGHDGISRGAGPQARQRAAMGAAVQMDSARRTVAMANRTFNGAIAAAGGKDTSGGQAGAGGLPAAAPSRGGKAGPMAGSSNPLDAGAMNLLADFGGGGAGGGGAGGGGAGAGGGSLGSSLGAPMGSAWHYKVNFGEVYTYETAIRQIILMNTGSGNLKVNKVEKVGGSDAFTIASDKCTGATIPAGRNCLLQIRYAPKEAAINNAAFEFQTGAGEQSGLIPVQVTGDARGAGLYSKFRYRAGEGYLNRAEFGEVPEGYSLEQKVRLANTTSKAWKNIRVMSGTMPYNFRTTRDNCTSKTLEPGQSCEFSIKYTPTSDVNKPICGQQYGQFHAVDTATGAKSIQARPKHPQYIIKGPVEAKLQGTFQVVATVKASGWWGMEERNVINMPVRAMSSAPFPVSGLTRMTESFYFK